MTLIRKFTAQSNITEPFVQAGAGLIPKQVDPLEGIGAQVTELGKKFKVVEDNRDVAEGIAEYNNIINTYNESLATKDPSEYVSGFNELQGSISKVTEGMSAEAANVLKNKTVIWNEVNRASLATLAIKQTASFAKQEIPTQLANFIANDQIDEANDYIDNYGESVLSPKEVGLWKQNIVRMKQEFDMWEGINFAVANPLPENITQAEAMIRETNKADPEESFRVMNTFRAKMGAKKKELTEARKALVNAEANNILSTVFEGKAYSATSTPENQQLVNQINARISNGDMEESDGITYNFMEQQVLSGKFFTDREIMEGVAGTEAGGMSQKETEDLISLNKQNKGLTIDQRDALISYGVETDTQYNDLKGIARLKLSENLQARVFAAVEEDKRRFKRELKRMVLAGETPEAIQTAIQANFIADSSKYVKGNFKRFFRSGINDFTDVVQDANDREKENEIILDLLKSGAIKGSLIDNVEDLFERFNE